MNSEVMKAKGKDQKANGKRAALYFFSDVVGLGFDVFLRSFVRQKNLPTFCLLPIAYCLLLSCAFAQDDAAAKRKYTLFNGTRVFFSLDTDAPDVQTQMATRIQVSDVNSVNRVLVDQKSGVFFGYTLKVEPVSGSNKYRVYLQPLSVEQETKIKSSKWYEDAQHANVNALVPGTIQSGRKPQSQPAPSLTPVTRFPAPQMLEDGDTIAVDVMVNPMTGTRISDRITISSKDLPLTSDSRKPARDFTLDDIEMKISNYRLLINNQMVTQEKPQAGCAGPIVWFYVPGEGRFIFSIKPRAGYDFQRIGAIEDNKIAFSVNGKNFEWQSESPIVGNGGKWNLYVLHDAKFEPDYEEYLIDPDEQAKKRILDFIRENCCLIGSAVNMDSLFGRAQAFLSTPPAPSRSLKGSQSASLMRPPGINKFLIQGAVRRAGAFFIEGKTTLFRLIVQAGGIINPTGPMATAIIQRELKSPLRYSPDSNERVDSKDDIKFEMFSVRFPLVTKGKYSDIDLEPGDTVKVFPSDLFFIVGEVNLPSEFEYREGLTLRQALEMAKGITAKANLKGALIYRKGLTGDEVEIQVDLAPILNNQKADVQLEANDIIVIPNRSPKTPYTINGRIIHR
ncbi:MAG: SLBB domain-containing protein [Blastocatellia bacterium]|nr:SLBB domain-containing protein [Blastocatellia bacterium]